jgi:hypothetical protein
MGMDSLMALELKNRLQTSLGCSMPATLAFDYPSIEALADYLSKQLFADEKIAEMEATQDSEDLKEVWAEVDQMSDEEVKQALRGKAK